MASLSLRDSKGIFLPVLILFAVCFLSYSNSLHNGFMLDDDIAIFSEKGVANTSFASLFFDHQTTFYRPIAFLTVKIACHLFGDNEAGYHLGNLFLFAVIASLFFVLIDYLFEDRLLAFLTSLLFCLHPINGMLVNYITSYTLQTFLVLSQLSMWLFLIGLDKGERLWHAGSLVLFILSLLAHEMGVIFPLYLVCVLYFLKNFKFIKAVLSCWPFFAVSLIFVLARMLYFSFNRIVWGTDLAITQSKSYIPTLVELLGWYFSKLMVPNGIILVWTGKMAEDYLALKTFAFFLAAGIIVYLVFVRWKRGLKPFALSLFVIGLAPLTLAAFTYYPFVGPMIEPHWFYFSSIGFFLLIAYGLLRLKEKINGKVWIAITMMIILPCVFLLRRDNARWKDQETYCRYWLSVNSNNLTPYYGLGKSLMEKGEYKDAIYYFQGGIDKLGYNHVYILADLGYCYQMTGQDKLALKFYRAALKEDPKYSLTFQYLGSFHEKRGDYQLAQNAYERARQLRAR